MRKKVFLLMAIMSGVFLFPISDSYGGDCYNLSEPRWSGGQQGYYIIEGIDKALAKGAANAIQQGAKAWNCVIVGGKYVAYKVEYKGTLPQSGTWVPSSDRFNAVGWKQLPADEAAKTSIYGSGSVVSEVDIAFNENVKWSASTSCPSDKFDVQSTAAHEFGHFARLADVEYSSCYGVTMYWEASRGAIYKRDLTDYDRSGLHALYGNCKESFCDCGGGGGGCAPARMGLSLPLNQLHSLSELSKETLSGTDGNLYSLYLQFSDQITILLSSDPFLRSKTKKLIEEFMPHIEAVSRGDNSLKLKKGEIEMLDAWLVALSERASPDMKKEIEGIQGVLKTDSEISLVQLFSNGDYKAPTATRLFQNYPNPLNPSCLIPFELAEEAEVTIRIYSLNGQLVRTLGLGLYPAGKYKTPERAAYWDGRDGEGKEVASGTYLYQLQTGNIVSTRKMIVLK